MIDVELAPFIFVLIVTIIFLFIALFFNFICRENISEDEFLRRQITNPVEGHVKNILVETINKENGKIKFIDIKQAMNDCGVIYIKGSDDISENIKNGSLIQLEGEEIYTVNFPSAFREGQTINIWNASTVAKNLKSETKFIIDGVQKSQVITLKTGKIISFQSNGKYWIALSPTDFSENKDMILKHLLSKVDLAIESSRLSLDSQLGDTHNKLINQLKEDKEFYKCEVEKTMRAFENDMDVKLSGFDIESLQKEIYNKIKPKIDSSVIVKHDLLDVIKTESSKLNEKLNDMKEQISQEIAYAIVTDSNDLKKRLTNHIEINANIAREESLAKINTAIRNQQQSIMERVEHEIENISSTKVKTAMIDMKESLLLIIQSKTKDDSNNVKTKFDSVNQRITNVETYFKTTIDSEILTLQQKMQSIIVDMKANLISIIDDKINKVNTKIENLKKELSSMIENSNKLIRMHISTTTTDLRFDIYSELDTIKASFNKKLTQTKDNISDIIDGTHEYIDEQIVEVQTSISSQINIIQQELQLQRVYIDSKISSGDKFLTELGSQVSLLQGQVAAMKSNLYSGSINVDNLIASTINLSNKLNGWIVYSTEASIIGTDGSQNTFMGTSYGMNNNSIYNSNTGVGSDTFSSANMTIGCNTMIGSNSFRNSTGDYNTGVGSEVGEMISSYGSFFGYQSGSASNGKYNSAFGYQSGSSLNGNYNTLLGALTKSSSYSYSTAIGSNATITSDNQIMLGGLNNGVYPTTVVSGPLSINGGIKFQGNAGYFMCVNESGQYSYTPLVMSTPSVIGSDYSIILNPGYKIIGYSASNYSGSSYIFDNTDGYQMLSILSNTLYGDNSKIMSYQLYYNNILT